MNDKPFITVSVAKELKEDVARVARQFHLSQSDITRMALIAFLEKIKETGILEVRKEEV